MKAMTEKEECMFVEHLQNEIIELLNSIDETIGLAAVSMVICRVAMETFTKEEMIECMSGVWDHCKALQEKETWVKRKPTEEKKRK